MFKSRKSLKKLKNLLSKERVIILLGSRQVGKTTLLQMLKTELEPGTVVHYFTMETPSSLLLFDEGVKGLRQKGILNENQKIVLMVDEFHYLNDPNHLFKEIYDTFPNVSIVASGSSSIQIHQKIKESLAGRKLTLYIYPLDFYEYLQFLHPGEESLFDNTDLEGTTIWSKKIATLDLQPEFQNFVIYGGLPKVVLEQDLETKKLFLEEIFTTYIQKDIKGILKNIEITPFNQLIQLAAVQTANLLNVSELSNTIHLPRNQVLHHLEVLEETYVNFLLKPFATNKRKEVVKMPKTFFYDNGMRNQILKHFGPLKLRSDAGALLENAVFMELKKNLMVSQELYFWRTKNKTEVDFVLRQDEKLFPIEVKLGSEKNILPNLESFLQTHNADTAFILNATEWFVKREGNKRYVFLPHFLAGKIPEWINESSG